MMINITNYKRSANLNYNEVLPHTIQNGSSKNLQTAEILRGSREKQNPPKLLWVEKSGAPMEKK